MTEWKEYKLGEIAEIITGYPFPGDKYESTGNLRVVRGENVTIGNLRWDTEKHWNHETEGLEKYFLQSGDIVIGMDGSRVGDNRAKVKQVDLPLILAQRVACLRAKKEFSQDYLWYTIFSDNFKKYIEAIHTGTSIPHISQKQIEDFEILCPPVETQRRIAAILSSLDDKIDLLHRENATLEQMAETMFRQWFVEESKEEWEEVLLGDLIDIGSGKGLPRSEFVENGLYSILGANGEIGKTNKYLVSESDRVIYTGRVGTLGNVFRIENKKAWLSDNTLVVRPKDYYYFVYFVLKCARLQDFNVGSTQPLIRQSDIKEIEIFLPDGNSLKAFEKECNDIYKKIDSNNNQIQILIQARDGLLPRLMSGEVKI